MGTYRTFNWVCAGRRRWWYAGPRWASLPTAWGVLVGEFGDGKIVGVTNGVEGRSVSCSLLVMYILSQLACTYQSSSCVVVEYKVKS